MNYEIFHFTFALSDDVQLNRKAQYSHVPVNANEKDGQNEEENNTKQSGNEDIKNWDSKKSIRVFPAFSSLFEWRAGWLADVNFDDDEVEKQIKNKKELRRWCTILKREPSVNGNDGYDDTW